MADGFRVDGFRVDGSWMLSVFVTDLQVEKRIRVKGDMHVGGVMFKLVEDLQGHDWSDHALFWPDRNQWLLRTKSTLDQYSVDAEATLTFTPMHKTLRVQLPDLRHLDCRVDFSAKCFNAVIDVCKELGIRHPEELSFAKPLEAQHLKYNYQSHAAVKSQRGDSLPADTNTFISKNGSAHSSNNSLDGPGTPRRLHSSGGHLNTRPLPSPTAVPSPPWDHSLPSTPRSPFAPTGSGTWRSNASHSPYSTMNSTLGGPGSPAHNVTMSSLDSLDSGLTHSPIVPAVQARRLMVHPHSLLERARMNVAWLDSSLSIMEQGIREFDTLLLRFKFYSFYDLDPKYDAVRINMLYEQAKWQILNEEIDCTEEEMLLFAGLQLQVNLQSSQPQPELNDSSMGADDIDSALNDLQVKLEGSHVNGNGDITQIPELSDYLRFFRPKKFTLKGYKRYWFVCKDLMLYLYKARDDVGQEPAFRVNLKGCEVTPDVVLASSKFGIKLEVPSPEGMSDMIIRCDSEQQYARWMAACRLGAKGKTMADASYDQEVRSILDFLAMQRPAPAPAINPQSLEISPEDYVPPRFIKKLKSKLHQRILEAHANVVNCNLIESKMNYIKSWKALPEFGITYFVVKFLKAKREELLGIAFNRLMRMDLNGGHLKTWRYNTMKAWNVNWEVRHMMVQFDEESVVFECLSSDCKVVHEFIGGYIFLQVRSKDSSQTLDHELFHKLTGGWR
ncbi:unc-112-related protein-like isoform X2 [Amphibalanus amphitrite]|uniref:unc-112-related protein-like isoform X2 n=1 Tax=Amphibalanus amphitrite TaxID=1232801 RepID=UPI001C90D560|nr:unc-112-related protein-like isoform X2 [Amphibalanus amphitrite]XP_043244103.1 unc-112-related protein-like isoform X2 [Amphibalanus amphitrite]